MVHTNPAYAEESELPITNPFPNMKQYHMKLVIAPEYMDLMSRDAFIARAEVEAEKLARAMVNKMVEEYDERHNPTQGDTVVS